MAKPRGPKKNETVPNVEAAATPATNLSVPDGNGSAATTTKRSLNKPTIVKTESRPNLVPINLDEEIRRLAYLLSERRGFQPGHEAEDWLEAEREVRQRYHQYSA